MKRKSILKTSCGIVCCMLASLVIINEAQADGTEQLGLPSIPIAQGSYILVSGTGLIDAQPGDISIEIPDPDDIVQVLLYWTGRTSNPRSPSDETVLVNGTYVTGQHIGGPTPSESLPSHTYRADITDVSADHNWILSGQNNVLHVDEMDFNLSNDGAAVVVILDDGSTADIQIMDGNDYAYLNSIYNKETEPVVFSIDPSADPRMGRVWLIVSDIDVPRPAAVDITVGGVTTRLDDDVFQYNEGDFLDVLELEVSIPAFADSVTMQLFSIEGRVGTPGYKQTPASLVWSFVSWELPDPVYEDEGCTYTQGYWKNHPENWPTDELSLWDTGAEAMEILWTKPKRGNAYIILAHQYIAAELNMVNGASIPDDVALAWFAAQDLLLAYKSGGNIDKNTAASDRAWAIDLAVMLDEYNNGLIGPGHCDEIQCKPKPDKCDTKKVVKKITSPKSSPEACDKKEQDKKDKKDR